MWLGGEIMANLKKITKKCCFFIIILLKWVYMWLGGEIMANLKNAKKRISVNIKKEARNNEYSASAKTAVKNTLRAIAKKDKAQAEANLKTAIKRIDKAAGAGVIAKNTSARKKSRLTKKVNAME